MVEPKDIKKWLEKAFRKGKITQDYYNSKIEEIEKEISIKEKQDNENALRRQYRNNPTIDFRNGHIVTKLKCPSCETEGENTYGNMEFKLLGKDKEGFIYLECPNCKEHLQYDSMTGSIKTRKGLLGFLFGRYG